MLGQGNKTEHEFVNIDLELIKFINGLIISGQCCNICGPVKGDIYQDID